MQQVTRVPVISSEGKPLMPTTPARARKWIKAGKAVPKRNKLGVFYVQLVAESSGSTVQPVVAGVDRGKCFTGIAFGSQLATIAIFHLCLPGFYKSKKKTKDRQSVTGKMAKREGVSAGEYSPAEPPPELRRSRRANRIDRECLPGEYSPGNTSRSKPFKLRNHREKRFSNRNQSKLPPSIRANRQMELRVLNEMANILRMFSGGVLPPKHCAPVTEIRDEDCGGDTKRNGRGISPVTVGQEWFRTEAAKIAPVVNVDSRTTGNYRDRLGLWSRIKKISLSRL